MPNVSFADDTHAWNRLISAVDTNVEDLPHLVPQRQELEALLEQAKTLRVRQMKLESRLRQTTQELRATVAEGRDLASRLRAGFKQVYGAHSAKLLEAGSRPRRKPRRKRTPAAEAGAEERPS
jgi:ABC-type transporter Mla subunit MlaD